MDLEISYVNICVARLCHFKPYKKKLFDNFYHKKPVVFDHAFCHMKLVIIF